MLNFLQQKYNTDKFTLGYVDKFYNELFVPRSQTACAVMEIGIYGGESIMMWNDFFQNAFVYGLDITPPRSSDMAIAIENSPRVKTIIRDSYTQETVDMMKSFHPEGYDIIIDDGPHTFPSMVFFLNNYLPLLKTGGVLVLEDIISRDWTPMLVNEIDPSTHKIQVHDMRNLQKTEHLLNLWRGGLDVITVEKIC